jgi:hypothetical protein
MRANAVEPNGGGWTRDSGVLSLAPLRATLIPKNSSCEATAGFSESARRSGSDGLKRVLQNVAGSREPE